MMFTTWIMVRRHVVTFVYKEVIARSAIESERLVLAHDLLSKYT